MQTIRPEHYRHLEEFAERWFAEQGWQSFRTGQEYCPTLGRWSPDFWVNAGFWADAKLRNRGYRDFLIECAEIERHLSDFPDTIYVLVGDEPLEMCGWLSAHEALQRSGDPRNDHDRPGSGDTYVQIAASFLHPMKNLVESRRRFLPDRSGWFIPDGGWKEVFEIR